jgi:probable HAF family extracellular repeat protein
MRSRKIALCLLMSVCFIAATATAALAQAAPTSTQCGFQTLTFPPPANTGFTMALNDLGAILGGFVDSQSHTHGFLLYQGNFTTFMFPGSVSTTAHDNNAKGTIVGEYNVSGDAKTHPFMAQSGGFHEITLPGFPNASAIAFGVNENGDVVGTIASATEFFGMGYLLHNGKLTILSFPGAQGGTVPASINDQGVIVGNYHLTSNDNSHGFMWKDGVFSNINPPQSNGSTIVSKISNTGAVVGTYISADGFTHGFAFADGTYTTIDVPNSTNTFIRAVNKFDNVLAAAQQGANTVQVKEFCSAVF